MLFRSLKHALTNYSWPGNIRQLENTVRKFLVLRDPHQIASEIEQLQNPGEVRSRAVALPPQRALHAAPAPEPKPNSMLAEVARSKREAETEVILAALDATRWNRKLAAARLQIEYKAFLYKMRKLSIEDQVKAEPVSA